MVAIIQDRDTVDGWFLFDSSAENASQPFVWKNQTFHQQMSYLHGDFGMYR
jgi:hypothetical protein